MEYIAMITGLTQILAADPKMVLATLDSLQDVNHKIILTLREENVALVLNLMEVVNLTIGLTFLVVKMQNLLKEMDILFKNEDLQSQDKVYVTKNLSHL